MRNFQSVPSSSEALLATGSVLMLMLAGIFAPAKATASEAADLNFDLSPSDRPTPVQTATSEVAQLAVPEQAIAPPVGSSDKAADLPPPPEAIAEPLGSPVQQQVDRDDGTLNFALKPSPSSVAAPISIPPAVESPAPSGSDWSELFVGEADSLVAIAVGSAEGTRTPEGKTTPAYSGHRDPGNGVWNLGSFSYQHGAASPQEADAKQLQRLQAQAQQLHQQASLTGMVLTLEQSLNGIDLANQAPAAALGVGGYIDRLAEAERMGFKGGDAILWARTRAFLDPETQRWNAPGLGNTVEGISRDQERRMQAIAGAIATQSQRYQSVQTVQTEDALNRLLSLDLPHP